MKTCPVCDSAYPSSHTNCPTDGAVLIEMQELAPGSMVRGKYRITRKIGQGGMGVVYLAEHVLLGGKVALKFLAADKGGNPQLIKRFRNEARVSFQLRHPNIVEVLDLDQAEDGSLFIAMEYVDGPSLRMVVGGFRQGMPIDVAVALARGIAKGLGVAHAKGVVHRDVKPENVLLIRTQNPEDQPKVLDFGIAAMLDVPAGESRTRGLMLTPEYAAPEQWRGTPAAELDGRADLYALGAVFFEMLTGQKIFHAHTLEGWMFEHLQTPPRAPSMLRPEVAQWPGLDAQVLRLLSKDRNLRHRDADELLHSLQSCIGAPDGQSRGTVLSADWNRRATIVEPIRSVPNAPTPVGLSPMSNSIPPPFMVNTPAGPVRYISTNTPPPLPPPVQPQKRKGIPAWVWAVAAVLLLVAAIGVVKLIVGSKSSSSSSQDQSSNQTTATTQPQDSDTNPQPQTPDPSEAQKQQDQLKAQQAAAEKAKRDADDAAQRLRDEEARAQQADEDRKAQQQAEQEQQAREKAAQVERAEDQVIVAVGGDPSTLTSEQKAKFIHAIQTHYCTCGCGRSVLGCFKDGMKCDHRGQDAMYWLNASRQSL